MLCVCLQLNLLRYTNLLEMGVTGLIQELLETCIYCSCVIGTICWHEVITCEHHVSIDQKCSFILTASHSLDKSCMAELSTLGFYNCASSMIISASVSFLTLLCFAGGQSAKVENCFIAWAC